MALRTEMTTRTDDQILLAAIDKRVRPASASFDSLGAGWHITTVAVRTAVKLNAAQMDALESAIEAIAGVSAARVLIQGPDGGVPALPATHEANLLVEMRFNVTEVPVP
jgi:hypothetical protein